MKPNRTSLVLLFIVALLGAAFALPASAKIATLAPGAPDLAQDQALQAASPDIAPDAADAPKPKWKDDEVVVKFKEGVSPETIQEVLTRLDIKVRRYITSLDIYVLKTKRFQAESMLAALRAEPSVEWAELNYIARAVLHPTDPDYNTTNPIKVYAPQRINAETAWDFTIGSPNLTVAVLDTGISMTHTEFAGRILPGPDFVNDDNDASDDNGHGTHVSGIVAAGINNGIGMVGIAPGVKILPVKVLDAAANGSWADVASGITYAVNNGARVINMSLGGLMTSEALIAAIVYAAEHDVFIVASSGNGNSSESFYPAYYDETMAVAATTFNSEQRWTLSNYGPWLDISAPGDSIWSTNWIATNPNGFGFKTGTSMAAPHVAGLAALLFSSRPELSSADVRAIIQQTAVDLGAPGWDPYYGWGRINAGAALIASQTWTPYTPTPTPTPTNTPTPVTRYTLNVSTQPFFAAGSVSQIPPLALMVSMPQA